MMIGGTCHPSCSGHYIHRGRQLSQEHCVDGVQQTARVKPVARTNTDWRRVSS